MMVEW